MWERCNNTEYIRTSANSGLGYDDVSRTQRISNTAFLRPSAPFFFLSFFLFIFGGLDTQAQTIYCCLCCLGPIVNHAEKELFYKVVSLRSTYLNTTTYVLLSIQDSSTTYEGDHHRCHTPENRNLLGQPRTVRGSNIELLRSNPSIHPSAPYISDTSTEYLVYRRKKEIEPVSLLDILNNNVAALTAVSGPMFRESLFSCNTPIRGMCSLVECNTTVLLGRCYI